MVVSRLLVIGNGMASLRFIEEINAIAANRFAITVVGDEPTPAYNRVLLSPLLAGEIATADVAMRPHAWYGDNGIVLLNGVKVDSVDTARRTAQLSNGQILEFDACVFATGSDPIRLPIPGRDLQGVHVFRSLADIEHLSSAASASARVVVIGGGLLGIEAAYGLKRAGAAVTLIHLMDRLMERQLDANAATLLTEALVSKGIDVCLNAETSQISGTASVQELTLKDGRTLPADLIVMAIGIKPRTTLAAASGLQCARGICVDDHMQTACKGIFAIGECAEHRGIAYGLVEPAYEQARIAARVLCGLDASYNGTVLATNLKVSGVPVFSAGDFTGAGSEHIVWRDDHSGSYRKFVVRDGQLTGAVLVGDTTDALWYRDLIRSGQSIAAFRSTLAFGRAYAEAA
jgi:nitrite reductase (NADH) large subunit